MQFIPFPESNRALGRPAEMSDQECGTLHVYADGQQCISCWQLSAEEIETCIMNDGKIWLGVCTSTTGKPVFTQPPVFLAVNQPHMPRVVLPAPAEHELVSEIENALQQFAKRLPDPSFAGKAPERGDVLRRLNPDLRQYHDGRPLDLGQLYFVSSDEIQEAHLVAMRQVYRQGGRPALADYLKPYNYFLDAPNALPIA